MIRTSIAALLVLVLAACSANNKRIPIGKSLKDRNGKTTGSTVGEDQTLAQFATGECLDLHGLAAALEQKGEAFVLYTHDLDLGKAKENDRHDFLRLGDDILRGQAIKASSVKLTTKGSKSLADATALGGLLAVKSQEACDRVVMTEATGESTWDIVTKTPSALFLHNGSTDEVRKYLFGNKGQITIVSYKPVTKQNCQGQNLDLIQREGMTIAWDGRLNDGLELPVSFVSAVAKHIKLPPAFNVAPVKDEDSERETAPQSLKVPQAQFELFKTIIEDGKFDGIECAKK